MENKQFARQELIEMFELLNRATLQGKEVPAFNNLMNKITGEIRKYDEEANPNVKQILQSNGNKQDKG